MKPRNPIPILAMLLPWMLPLAVSAQTAPAAHEWPIETATDDGVYRLRLPLEVYQHIARRDLSDVFVRNARGEPVPFGPIAEAIPSASPPAALSRPLPWFRVPRSEDAASGESLSVHLTRDADGRLRGVSTNIDSGGTATVSDIVLDASALEQPLSGLQLHFENEAQIDVSARFDVLGSNNLADWSQLRRDEPILLLRQDGFVLDRRRIDLPTQRVRYLLLRRVDSASELPLAGVDAWTWEPRALPQTPERPLLETAPGTPSAIPGVFEYSAPGPLLVERVDVVLADTNAIADVVLRVRDEPSQPWQELRRFTAFQVATGSKTVQGQPEDVGSIRARYWQVQTMPAQPRAPSLLLTWRREDFVFVAQGEGPFRLLAGDAQMRRPVYPLEVLLRAVRGSVGADWQPTEAGLGAHRAVAPQSAGKPASRIEQRTLLWIVLVVGALIVVVLVLRLLRERGDAQ